jgi:hypothetical protein
VNIVAKSKQDPHHLVSVIQVESSIRNEVVSPHDQKIMLLTASRLRCPVRGESGGVPARPLTEVLPGT